MTNKLFFAAVLSGRLSPEGAANTLTQPASLRIRHRGDSAVSDRDCPVRDGPQRSGRAISRGVQREAGALRRKLHGNGLQ
jgi:hypothetical protein